MGPSRSCFKEAFAVPATGSQQITYSPSEPASTVKSGLIKGMPYPRGLHPITNPTAQLGMTIELRVPQHVVPDLQLPVLLQPLSHLRTQPRPRPRRRRCHRLLTAQRARGDGAQKPGPPPTHNAAGLRVAEGRGAAGGRGARDGQSWLNFS